MTDDLVHVPDHLIQIARLALLAIHRQPDAAVHQRAHLFARHDGPHRPRRLEALGDLPGATLRLQRRLQVAPRQVQTHRIAVDEFLGPGRIDIRAATAQGHYQLHFVVQRLRARGVGHRQHRPGGHRHHRTGGLHEEEGILATAGPHLHGMLRIVLRHAEHPIDRKPLCNPVHRQAHGAGRCKDIRRHEAFPNDVLKTALIIPEPAPWL